MSSTMKKNKRKPQKKAEPRRSREKMPERPPRSSYDMTFREPDPNSCAPGSVRQQLDMCESGPLRGDEILHDHGVPEPLEPEPVFGFDMSEEAREGMEMSGDEHSAGLQGEEQELAHQDHILSGVPGAEEEAQDTQAEYFRERRRSA